MFEIMVGIFIITNTCLQIGWFLWSYTLSRRKHIDDSRKIEGIQTIEDIHSEIESLQAEFDILEKEKAIVRAEAEISWRAFLNKMETTKDAKDAKNAKNAEADPNNHLIKDYNGRYNHKEIKGGLDEFFSK